MEAKENKSDNNENKMNVLYASSIEKIPCNAE